MGDRELLELSAKAYGLTWQIGQYGSHRSPMFRWKNNDNPNCTIICDWNPLNSDGDALRLAVKLGLHIGICLDLPVGDCSYAKTDSDQNFIDLHHESSPAEATRRAIVRAAAEIGKTK